jgi:hypothetical protein
MSPPVEDEGDGLGVGLVEESVIDFGDELEDCQTTTTTIPAANKIAMATKRFLPFKKFIKLLLRKTLLKSGGDPSKRLQLACVRPED